MTELATRGTQAVDRAALLVSTVVQARAPLAFSEIAEGCGLPKSTTSRLLTALERTELVQRTDSGAYVAGPLFSLYASRHDAAAELARLARPVMERIGDETGETVNLGVARGDRVTHLAQIDSRFLLGTRDWTRLEVPPYASALGMVLYAWGVLPLPEGPFEPLTAHTVRTTAQLGRVADATRRAGYAATVDELEDGLTGVAAPVRGAHDEVVAALGLSGPTQRLAERLPELGALMTRDAASLSGLLRTSPDAVVWPLAGASAGGWVDDAVEIEEEETR